MAEVSAVFFLGNDEVLNKLDEIGIKLQEDNLLLLSRSINKSGKTSSRANGKVITIGMLKEIGHLLIDIHGQHEHQALLNESNHIVLLDKFCDFGNKKNELAATYKKYRAISKKIDGLSSRDKLHTVDMLTYQVKEIESAKIMPGEEERLLARKKILNSYEKISLATGELAQNLYDGGEFGLSAVDMVNRAINNLGRLLEVSQEKRPLYDRLEAVKYELDDISDEIRAFANSLEYDVSEIDDIESRLGVIYKLKRKYGNSVADILNYLEKIKYDLSIITNAEEGLKQLQKEQASLSKSAMAICSEISDIRKKQAGIMKSEIQSILMDLGMKDVKMEASIKGLESFGPNGFDSVEFLISPNLGEPLKPLSKIASGGEMSRIMLALKTMLAKVYSIGTFIFDEIDTGVSGRTAQRVAEKLKIISKSHQILCITHLPQIAAMADSHFLIEKKTVALKTYTNINKLLINDSVNEIARLISGASITGQTLKTANEMIMQAQNFVC
jgi:DNA repair protein RecN (Recombination protein N)